MLSIKTKAKEVLSFLNLLDRSGKLSITNTTLYVLLIKVAVAPQLTIADAAVLFLGILGYAHKRYEANQAAKAEAKSIADQFKVVSAEFDQKLTEVKDAVGKVSMAVGFKR